MQFTRFNIATETGDEYDSVTYAEGNTKKYWFPNQLNYRFWEGKKNSMLWDSTDYTKLLNNYNRDFPKLFLLIQCINNNNIIVNSHGIPVYTNKQISELININYNSRPTKQFFKELCDKNIIKKDKEKKLAYLSPFVSMKTNKLYIGCYKMFREELFPILTAKQRENLEKRLEKCIEQKQI